MCRKYDDVMMKQPTRWIGSIDFKRKRVLALEAMLPRWSGFCGQSAERDQQLTAKEAVAEFFEVVSSITLVPVWEDNQPEQNWRHYRPRALSDQSIVEVSTDLFVKASGSSMSGIIIVNYRQLRSILILNCNV